MRNNSSGYSHCGCAIGHVDQDNAERPDTTAVADAHSAEHLRIGAKLDVVANHRYRTVLIPIADGDALPQRAIRPDDGVPVHEYAAEMPDPQARTDTSGFRQTDADGGLHGPEHCPIDRREHPFNQTFPPPLEASAETIDPDRPDRLLLEKGAPRSTSAQVLYPVRITGH